MITETVKLNVPTSDETYVKSNNHDLIKKIIKSKIFYPIYVSGFSGYGKTLTPTQVCHELKRKMVRVNISIETDEDDLIGGYVLVDGNIVFRKGPVLVAMEEGAVVLLDEIDRGSNKLMCLQAILEGEPYYNKKTGETIYPAEGFNVIATANTKGQMTEVDDRYVSAQILDDALLERFAISVEQSSPSMAVEKRIVQNNMKKFGCYDEDFSNNLVDWADLIRKSYENGAVNEIVSTRRLVYIVKTNAIFADKVKAIDLCISRYDGPTKQSFIDLYKSLDPTVSPESDETANVVETSNNEA